jgi:hypothetical protein
MLTILESDDHPYFGVILDVAMDEPANSFRGHAISRSLQGVNYSSAHRLSIPARASPRATTVGFYSALWPTRSMKCLIKCS